MLVSRMRGRVGGPLNLGSICLSDPNLEILEIVSKPLEVKRERIFPLASLGFVLRLGSLWFDVVGRWVVESSVRARLVRYGIRRCL